MHKFFNGTDYEWNKTFLSENNIAFIYVAKPELKQLPNEDLNALTKVFENGAAVIYKHR